MELKGDWTVPGSGVGGGEGKQGSTELASGLLLRCDFASFLCTRDRVPQKRAPGRQAAAQATIQARVAGGKARRWGRSHSALGRAAASPEAPLHGSRRGQDGEACARLRAPAGASAPPCPQVIPGRALSGNRFTINSP